MHISPTDIKIEPVYFDRGGQYVMWNYPLRVTHIPTGTVVQLTGRSQHAARALALEMLEHALSDRRLY